MPRAVGLAALVKTVVAKRIPLLVSLTIGRQPWQPLAIAEASIVYFAKMKGRSKKDGFRINVLFKAVVIDRIIFCRISVHLAAASSHLYSVLHLPTVEL
jgi:hypothetical protein